MPKIGNAEQVAIEQRVAQELIKMVRQHKALNAQEQRLMDAICAEVGTKYGILPPQEGFKIERLEEKMPTDGQWF